MNFLESNQKEEIRLKVGNITLREPSDEQLFEIKKLILNQDIKLGEEKGQVSYSVVRYIIRECCDDGAFIDEYTDEQIVEKIVNGNRNLKKLDKAVAQLIEEILEDIAYETEKQVKMFNDLLNTFNVNGDITKLKTKWNKLNKKYKWNVSFDDLINNVYKKEELENKIKEVK